MKKILFILFLFCVLLLCSCELNIDLKYESDFKFILNNNDSYTIYGKEDNIENLVIPETYKGKLVTRIGYKAFYAYKNLKTVKMSNNITDINDFAFYKCTNVEEISISDNIEHIGYGALPSKNDIYTEWNDGTYIGNENNPYLILTSQNTEKATTFVINERTRVIGNYAIDDDSYLKSLEIPDSVVTIENNRIKAELLTSFPNGLKYVGNLTYGQMFGKNKYKGGLYLGSNENPYMVLTGFEANVTNYEIHPDTKIIGDNAFEHEWMTEIAIPEGVTTIGRDAFFHCPYLEKISFPESLVRINDTAFWRCYSLKELIIPENVKLIGSAAFYDEVSALESIKLPSKLEVIEHSLFASCAKLVDIQIPDSVICIGYNAFNKCSSLKSIVIPDSVIYIENSIFSNCTSLETVYNNSVLKLDAKTLGCEEAEVYNKREWKNVNGIPTPIKK